MKNDKRVYYNEKEEGSGLLGVQKDESLDQAVLVTKVSASSRKQEYHITTRYSLKLNTGEPEQWIWATKWQE